MAAPPTPAPPPPELAALVRAGNWAEVRTATASLPAPLSPAVAVVAARAARVQGRPDEARRIVRGALPAAGELGAALRIESAEAALVQGQNPLPAVQPLLARTAPAAHRRAAIELLRRGFETLPVPVLRQQLEGSLHGALRAELRAALAVRGSSHAMALGVVRGQDSRRAAVAAARFLATRPLGEADRLLVGEALLSGGAWREARTLLEGGSEPAEPAVQARWFFLRGRAAYRLGDFTAAATLHERALAVAPAGSARYAPAVQRARIAEIGEDHARAMHFWDIARSADARENEGWDGALRTRVALGKGEDAVRVWQQAPARVQTQVGPRLAAVLLARSDRGHAAAVLAKLPRHLPQVRLLEIERLRAEDKRSEATEALRELLGDPRSRAWAELGGGLLPPDPELEGWPAPARDRRELARVAVEQGALRARLALTLALAAEPDWAPLLAGAVPAPQRWSGPAEALVEVGMEKTAAALYPHRFPAASPAELAWSARMLTAWGNPPSGLDMGERLWSRLGVPAILVPETLGKLILPDELVAGCVAAAGARQLPASWLIGVVRQESRFDTRARSTAGAVGLAQLVPETMRRLGLDTSDAESAGAALGAAAGELARLCTAFEGRLGRAAAAYNAGDPIVRSWLGILGENCSDIVFAVAVPYAETSTYVLKVTEGEALAQRR